MKNLLAAFTTGITLTMGTLPGIPVGDALAADLAINQDAPNIELTNQDGKVFKLTDRKGKWTVVYFYPKAGSPGCTEQACAFRDAIRKIEARNAILVGISSDSQQSQKEFHSTQRLTFDLLSDTKGDVLSAYGVKIPLIGVARRTTFIIDPELKIRSIAKDVDPAFDAEWSAETLDELQEGESSKTEQSVVPATAPAVVPSSPPTPNPEAKIKKPGTSPKKNNP
jgi:peroxiredoxin Q/BCP